MTSVIIVFFSIKMEPLFLSVQQKLDRLNTVLQENIAGARLVKAFVRADHESQRFEAANEDLTERNVKVMTFMSTMSPVLTFFVNIGIVLVVYAGGLRVIQGSMTDGQIVAFINYLSTTMGPLLMMTMLANTWANGIASAGRVNEVLDTQPEVQDIPGAGPAARNGAGQRGSSRMSPSTTTAPATPPCSTRSTWQPNPARPSPSWARRARASLR